MLEKNYFEYKGSHSSESRTFRSLNEDYYSDTDIRVGRTLLIPVLAVTNVSIPCLRNSWFKWICNFVTVGRCFGMESKVIEGGLKVYRVDTSGPKI